MNNSLGHFVVPMMIEISEMIAANRVIVLYFMRIRIIQWQGLNMLNAIASHIKSVSPINYFKMLVINDKMLNSFPIITLSI